MPYDFEVSDLIPASPQEIYEAWLDGKAHGDMTGSPATASPRKGANFTAWDGYITGRNLVLDPGSRIVQSWRTSEFGDSDEDSQIEVLLEPEKGGTKVTIRHTGVPDGQTGYEKDGWQDNYFKPMKEYFKAKGKKKTR